MGLFGDNFVSSLGSGLGGLITAPLSFLGANIDRNYQSNVLAEQMNFQREMLDKQQGFAANQNDLYRQFVAEQNGLSRDWQAAQNLLARMFQNSQWEKQAKYNSPEEMVKRLNAAGINASVLLGNGQGMMNQTIQASAPSVGAASQMSPAALSSAGVSGSLGTPQSNFRQVLTDTAYAASALAKSGLDSASKNRMNTLLEGELYSQELANKRAKLDLDLANKTFSSKAKKLIHEIDEIATRIALNKELGKSEQERQWSLMMDGYLKRAQANFVNTQDYQLGQSFQTYLEVLKSQAAANRARAVESRAVAGAQSALEQVYTWQSKIEHLEYDVRNDPKARAAATQTIISNAELIEARIGFTNEDTAKLVQAKRLLEKQGDWYGWNQGYQMVMGIIDRAINAYGVATGRDMMQVGAQRNDIYRQDVENRGEYYAPWHKPVKGFGQ